jgi:chromosome partitioning protein
MTTFSLMQPKLSIVDAANFLGVSIQRIHHMLKEKNIAPEKLGNKICITHQISRKLFNIKFKKHILACQIVKGGSGKTTTVHNIAACANAYGARVLLIDADPQFNLTTAFNIDALSKPVLIDFLTGKEKIQDGIVTIAEGLDLVPSRIENVVLDNHLVYEKIPLHTFFNDLLSPILDNYDLIFIDCPPALGLSVTAAALFVNKILVPLCPDKFSHSGLMILKQEIEILKKRYKKDISFKVFINKFKINTLLSVSTLQNLTSDITLQNIALQTVVRASQEIPNLASSNQSVFSVLKKSSAKEDFYQLTKELLEL